MYLNTVRFLVRRVLAASCAVPTDELYCPRGWTVARCDRCARWELLLCLWILWILGSGNPVQYGLPSVSTHPHCGLGLWALTNTIGEFFIWRQYGLYNMRVYSPRMCFGWIIPHMFCSWHVIYFEILVILLIEKPEIFYFCCPWPLALDCIVDYSHRCSVVYMDWCRGLWVI